MATTTAKKKGIHFAWFVLIGVLLMMGLCRGGINSGMGLFFQPISADMHIGVGEVAMMSSISALITMFWSPFAGRLLDKFDIRIITVVAVAIQAGCFAALSLVDAVWGFYALAGIMAFGSVFATQLVGPMMINRWFKDKNGLAMGIMMSFVAICSAVLSPVVASIIASNGWRMGYIVLGVLALVILQVGEMLAEVERDIGGHELLDGLVARDVGQHLGDDRRDLGRSGQRGLIVGPLGDEVFVHAEGMHELRPGIVPLQAHQGDGLLVGAHVRTRGSTEFGSVGYSSP